MLQLQFASALLVALAIIYLPGYPVLRALGMPKPWAVCTAPAVSIGLFAIVSLVYCAAGIPCNPITVAAIPCIAASAAMVARRNHATEMTMRPITWKRIALYTGVGVLTGAILFLSALPSLGAFAQAWDNVHHINVIRSFADASSFDSIHESAYLADFHINPTPDAGFYPATWHAICAMVLQATGFHAGLIENVVNMAFCSVVFPLASLALITLLFNGNRRSILVGSVAIVSLPLFPWEMLAYGPLFPNLASFSCMPLAQWLFAYAIDGNTTRSDRIKSFAMLLLVCIGITFLQPNAIFTIAVLFAPLCAQRLWNIKGLRITGPRIEPARIGPAKVESTPSPDGPKCKRAIPGWFLSLLFCALCIGVWWFAYNAPFMTNVVHSGVWHWQFATVDEAISNVLTLAYVNGFYPSSPQLLSAALIVCGIAHSLKDRRYLWMSVSYLLTCVIVVASMSGDEFTKALISGFWYSDPFRCGAMASIAAIPVLILGATWIISLLAKLAEKIGNAGRFAARGTNDNSVDGTRNDAHRNVEEMRNDAHRNVDGTRHALEAVFAAIFIVVTFLPLSTFNNGLSSVSKVIEEWYSLERAPYDESEMKFVDEVMSVVEPDAIVVNMPYDGSVMAYGNSGLNLYYRYFSGYAIDGETEDSCLIRSHLKDAKTSENVRDSLRAIDAEYVLILHRYGISESFLDARYWDEAWRGLNELNDETPGFEVVLAEDDMRLYRITCL